ncbi:hypothetical protein [Leptospira sp. GIMC2001]|uniref:hypothetical protein n=1 Tax=Leptospira sp. GIMC2001 TaxID=1513297 RepID=UPI00234A187D|nr:hypothetical protein [Leptospira sp. GIMC2001]WCL51442.1 hypothetical protein O4O04_20210 [Leptospira sp. GIMC2001]
MGKFAQNTDVSTDRSKAEIEKTLRKYGAGKFMSGWDDDQCMAMIQFEMQGRRIKFVLPLPSVDKFRLTESGRQRKNNSDIEAAWEQACRQRWRALNLAIKAKLEMVECQISTFEEEFLSYIVTASGKTVGETIIPQIEEGYNQGRVPRLMLE